MNNINKTHRIDSIIPCLQILNDAKQINLIRLIKRIALVNVVQRKQTVAEVCVCVGGGMGAITLNQCWINKLMPMIIKYFQNSINI